MAGRTCRLCKQERELRKSHIIPEFFYTNLYDEKHRFDVLTILPSEPNSFLQKGLRERLLCGECEQNIGEYERYASLLFKGGLRSVKMQRVGQIIFAEGVNYAALKLFLLSLTWRMSISSNNFFSQVRLGVHEERFRCMLLSKDPGPALKYPCLIGGVTLDNGKGFDAITAPRRVKISGRIAYNMVIGNYALLHFVSNQAPRDAPPEIFLQQNGDLVLLVRPAKEVGPISSFMAAFNKLGRAPRLRRERSCS